jgi:hypothetical protein
VSVCPLQLTTEIDLKTLKLLVLSTVLCY